MPILRIVLSFLYLIGLLAVGMMVPAAEARPKPSALATAPAASLAKPPGTLIEYKPMTLPAFYRAKAWRILYVTRDFRQRPILSTGMVVLPNYAPGNPSQRSFVAWAHPTTGVARKCAPSLRTSPTKSISGLDDLVAAGVVVAATDYPGLGTEGPVGYLVGKGQAYAVLDSVRAAKQIPEVGGGPQFALWGYSQGGQAALFAADLARSYAPELTLKGVAAVAPPTDLGGLLRANMGTVPGRILTAMTLWSWTTKYSLPLKPLVYDAAIPIVTEVSRSCIDDLGGKLDALAAQKALETRFLSFDPSTRTPWDKVIWDNSKFYLSAKTPALILQGAADDLVRPDTTTLFVRSSCRQGVPVQYVTLPGKGHGGAIDAGKKQAVAWLVGRLRNGKVTSNCR